MVHQYLTPIPASQLHIKSMATMTKTADHRKDQYLEDLKAFNVSKVAAGLAARRAANLSRHPLATMAPTEYTDFRSERRQYRKQHRQRLARIYRQLIGADVPFPGTITIPSPEDARRLDVFRTSDILPLIRANQAKVYWTDGSIHTVGDRQGLLGAGVASYTINPVSNELQWSTAEFELGKNTGNVADAETYAIAAALQMALTNMWRGEAEHKGRDGGSGGLKTVRIFTDASEILRRLDAREPTDLGPMRGRHFAICDLFDRAARLAACGVAVELVWVKGHSASLGNKIAHRAANHAVESQHAAGVAELMRQPGALEWVFEEGLNGHAVWIGGREFMGISEESGVVAYWERDWLFDRPGGRG